AEYAPPPPPPPRRAPALAARHHRQDAGRRGERGVAEERRLGELTGEPLVDRHAPIVALAAARCAGASALALRLHLGIEGLLGLRGDRPARVREDLLGQIG